MDNLDKISIDHSPYGYYIWKKNPVQCESIDDCLYLHNDLKWNTNTAHSTKTDEETFWKDDWPYSAYYETREEAEEILKKFLDSSKAAC